MQIRTVSDRSGVAIATIYRYFGSRDRLAYVMATTWAHQMVREARISEAPHTASLDDFRRQIYASAQRMAAEPALLRTWARSVVEVDPAFAESFVQDSLLPARSLPPAPGADPREWA